MTWTLYKRGDKLPDKVIVFAFAVMDTNMTRLFECEYDGGNFYIEEHSEPISVLGWMPYAWVPMPPIAPDNGEFQKDYRANLSSNCR